MKFPVVACALKCSLKGLSISALPHSARCEPRDLGDGRDGFLEELKALPVNFKVVEADPCDVAARVRQARHESFPHRDPYPHDRYCVAGRTDRLRNRIGTGDDDVWIAIDDLAGEIGKAFRASLAGISVDDQVLPFDIAQAAQL
jgi:hypothetical protein